MSTSCDYIVSHMILNDTQTLLTVHNIALFICLVKPFITIETSLHFHRVSLQFTGTMLFCINKYSYSHMRTRILSSNKQRRDLLQWQRKHFMISTAKVTAAHSLNKCTPLF